MPRARVQREAKRPLPLSLQHSRVAPDPANSIYRRELPVLHPEVQSSPVPERLPGSGVVFLCFLPFVFDSSSKGSTLTRTHRGRCVPMRESA
jgi:hypothetical protein